MDWSEYVTEWLVRESLAERRALAAKDALIRAARPPRRPIRLALGSALIKLGHWLLGAEAGVAVPPHVDASRRLSGTPG